LLKLGAAKKEAGKAYTLLVIPHADEGSAGHIRNIPLHAGPEEITAGAAARRQLLLRSNIKSDDPGHLWRLLFAIGRGRASGSRS